MTTPQLTQKEIEERLKAMIIERLRLSIKPEDFALDATLFGPESSFDLDSIDALEITLGMEETFHFHIDEREIGKNQFKNLSTLAEFVQKKLSS